MPTNDTSRWKTLEKWRATLFLVGAAMFAVAAAITLVEIVVGPERLITVSQVFISAGWAVTLIGLLGLYAEFADRSRWLARAGALFATLGVLGFATDVILSLVDLSVGLPEGEPPVWALVFLIPATIFVFGGSLLAFAPFSVASLRSGVHSRTVGVLLLIPSVVFLTNIVVLPMVGGVPGLGDTALVFVVLCVLLLIHSSIGYLLRTEPAPIDSGKVEPSPDSTAR